METLERPVRTTPTRSRWRAAGLAACVLLTLLTGLVVGWFAVWFQLFGDRADAADYQSAAGGYGAAALLLFLAGGVLSRRAAQTWLLVVAFGGAALCTLLLLSSVSDMSAAEPGSRPDAWQDGALGVLGCPWTWPFVVLTVTDLVRRPARVSG